MPILTAFTACWVEKVLKLFSKLLSK